MQLYSSMRILASIFASFLLGFVFCAFAVVLRRIIEYSGAIIGLPVRALSINRLSRIREEVISHEKRRASATCDFFFDVIFVITYGVGVILFNYVFCDGIPRLYPLIISLGTCTLSYRVIGGTVEKLCDKMFTLLYRPVLALFFVVLYPVKRCISFVLRRFIMPVSRAILSRARDAREERTFKRKVANARFLTVASRKVGKK